MYNMNILDTDTSYKLAPAGELIFNSMSYLKTEITEYNGEENDFVKYEFGDFEDEDYPLIMLTIIINKYQEEDIENYLFIDDLNIMEDGTLFGDPVPNLTVVPSGTYLKQGGRFGCNRTSTHTSLCGSSTHAYVKPRGFGVGSGGRYHSGIDIYAALNTSLHSVLAGKVVVIDDVDDSNVGLTMTIKSSYNDKDIYLKYCHLNKISDAAKKALKDGSDIKQGLIIGETGNTGNAKSILATRYHVHIEASTDGVFYGGKTRVDPEIYFTTKFDSNGNTIED